MSRQTKPKGLDAPAPRSRVRVLAVGVAGALLWLLLFALLIWPNAGDVAALITAALPFGLIGFATLTALSLLDLRNEAEALRRDRDRLRDALSVRQDADDGIATATSGDLTVAVPQAERPGTKSPERALRETRHASPDPSPPMATPSAPAQAALPLGAAAPAALSLPDLVRALHFPETPDDLAGLRAMQRALRDHKARLVVQAAQDMLTLLSQDGIYMDDLDHDRAPPTLWRQFAAGDRRAEVMAVGAIHDAAALQLCRTRLQDNTVYRDTAHHFLRRFDHLLGDVVPELDDVGIEALSETRSARAFMLVGRAADVFGPVR